MNEEKRKGTSGPPEVCIVEPDKNGILGPIPNAKRIYTVKILNHQLPISPAKAHHDVNPQPEKVRMAQFLRGKS
jgi:hypothetical protein